MADLAHLLKQRAAYRGQITRLQSYISSVDPEAPNVQQIKVRLEQLNTLWPKIEEIQDCIEFEATDDEHTAVRETIELSYFDLKSQMLTLIEGNHSNTDGAENEHRASCKSQVKLPLIELPHFSGNYTQWVSFKDTFSSLIHDNSDISDIQKFQYLRVALKGEALQIIESIPITASNYGVAWKQLQERFDNKRLIAASHINDILHIKPVSRENAEELRAFTNTAISSISALKLLAGDSSLSDIVLVQHLTSQLDATTRKAFELEVNDSEFTTLDSLFQFLEHRTKALEKFKPISNEKSTFKPQFSGNPKQQSHKPAHPSPSRSYVSTVSPSCLYCKDTMKNNKHPLFACSSFKAATIAQKYKFLRENQICFNCLGQSDHQGFRSGCKAGSCKYCGEKHNSLLHEDKNSRERQTQRQPSKSRSKSAVGDDTRFQDNDAQTKATYCSVKNRETSQVLLATAVIKIKNAYGEWLPCRALLDGASQSNIMTEHLAQQLRIKKQKRRIPIQGINEATVQAFHTMETQIKSSISGFTMDISCSILPNITGSMPAQRLETSTWGIPSDIQLADPSFHTPGNIDLLLSADVFYTILKPEKLSRTGNYPALQNTEFGWIVAGRIPNAPSTNGPSKSFFVRTEDTVNFHLQRFWELEDFHDKLPSPEEITCEKHFQETTSRDREGRYTVKLPLKKDRSVLGDSLQTAISRFNQLERRLDRNMELKREYTEFMVEYQQLKHMQPIGTLEDVSRDKETRYYIPHHCVIKESSKTTRLRVVFDGSSPTTTGESLNSIQMIGPTIQEELFSILLRFRSHKIALTADTAKMYRQINMHSEDRPLQCILWRASRDEPIHVYSLNTVTYGLTSSSFLATRCLKQLAEDESSNFTVATHVLTHDFYVDDFLGGNHCIEGAIKLRESLTELLQKGGFNLRKWCSNSKAVLQSIPEELKAVQDLVQFNTEGTKTLGISWRPSTDEFLMDSKVATTVDVGSLKIFSKRQVASIIAQVFDPIGLISPVVITYKSFLQQLWLHNVGWDDPLPIDLQKTWRRLHSQLTCINEVKVPRFVLAPGDIHKVQIHGFSDASERNYGSVLFVRSIDSEGHISVNLLCSKSKVAPVKRTTLPRLELCAAVLLAKLVHKALPILRLCIDTIHLWTDSKIVLAWLASPASKWKPFVANRVAMVQELTQVSDWKHVPSKDNPADLISRGVDAKTIRSLQLWWHGPTWLQEDETQWPSSSLAFRPDDNTIPEQRKVAATALVTHVTTEEEIISRYSSLSKLLRVVSLCKRFISNCRNSREKRSEDLTTFEIQGATLACIKITQRAFFSQEIKDLSDKQQVHNKSILRNLHPFLDNEKVIRVGGRLENSELEFQSKHQIILHPKSHFAKILISSEHKRLLHAGPQLLISSLREKYWIPRIRQVVKQIIHQCNICYRLKASAAQQLMGQLPSSRVRPSKAFHHVGVDYAGPYHIKTGAARSRSTRKCYIAVFTCLATRAIHLEIVSDLTSQAFIAALLRFTARRGKCASIFSDNATTFHGAKNELRELRKLFQSQEFNKDINRFAAEENFQWKYSPPRSPSFGGIFESAVKSMKYHLRRVAGNAVLTYEELVTLLCQIEACLNSRPLSTLPDSHDEFSYITPGHFLIGGPLTSFPEPNITDLAANRLSRWQRIQQFQQRVWRKWSQDYLHSLQQRQKWTAVQSNLKPGTPVLLKEDNLPPLSWRVGVIQEVFPGRDNLVRVVTVRTRDGVYKRALSKIVPLPHWEEDAP